MWVNPRLEIVPDASDTSSRFEVFVTLQSLRFKMMYTCFIAARFVFRCCWESSQRKSILLLVPSLGGGLPDVWPAAAVKPPS